MGSIAQVVRALLENASGGGSSTHEADKAAARACMAADDRGMVALHYACARARPSIDALCVLLKCAPAAAERVDHGGALPFAALSAAAAYRVLRALLRGRSSEEAAAASTAAAREQRAVRAAKVEQHRAALAEQEEEDRKAGFTDKRKRKISDFEQGQRAAAAAAVAALEPASSVSPSAVLAKAVREIASVVKLEKVPATLVGSGGRTSAAAPGVAGTVALGAGAMDLGLGAAAVAQLVAVLLRTHPELLSAPMPRSRRLPLHLACARRPPPLALLQVLLSEHPGAVSHADRGGCVPLHLLCSQGSGSESSDAAILGSVTALLTAQASCANAKDDAGRTALHRACAQQVPALAVVEALVRANPAACKHRDHNQQVPLQVIWNILGARTPASLLETLVSAYPESRALTEED